MRYFVYKFWLGCLFAVSYWFHLVFRKIQTRWKEHSRRLNHFIDTEPLNLQRFQSRFHHPWVAFNDRLVSYYKQALSLCQGLLYYFISINTTLVITLWDRYHYYSHCTHVGLRLQELKTLSKAMLWTWRSLIYSQTIWLSSPVLLLLICSFPIFL